MIRQVVPQSKTQRSLHFTTFSATLFLIILVVGCVAFWLSMRQVIRDNKGDELMRILEVERIKMEFSVNSRIAIILKMAESPLIVRYFSNPDDPELAVMALEEIVSYRHAIVGSIFWINDADKVLYFDDREPLPLDTDLPENYWYDLTLHRTESYNFNINHNPDLNVTNLWINAPVFNKERKPIGILGCGIDVAMFVQQQYDEYKDKADIYFFNAHGEITGAQDVKLVVAKEHIEKVLGTNNGIFASAQRLKPGEKRTFDSPLGKVAIGTVPALEWHSIAIMPNSIDDYKNHATAIFIVMLVVMALTISVLVAIFLKSLRKSIDLIEAASRYKSEFLTRMSHEVRTPMNAVLGMAELALRERDVEHIHRHVRMVKKSGKTLLTIINDILDLSKIESGKLEIVPANYFFHEMIDDVTNIVEIKVQESYLEFRVDIDRQIPETLFGDETRVRQVILNLLTNAVKYTSHGFVSLIVRGTVIDDNNVILTMVVADSGRGIKEKDIMKLFEDFTQFDRVQNKSIEGTGLGLAITKSLVKAMDGNISVRSEYGKGSTFTVILPQRISSDGESVANETFVSVFTAPDAKVLIVDDEPVNHMVAEGLLATYKMRLQSCMNGEEAVKAVQTEEYDLVFMDHLMPSMDGIETTAAIRSLGDERFQKLPIVALTASAILGAEEMFLKNGFSDYLSKPICSQRLNVVLAKWIPAEKQKR